jgi:ribosome-binding protein aMBF1 (putative translation factor)
MAHRKRHNDLGFRNSLGPGIRRIRETLGWSQEDLARRLQLAGWDVDRTLIARIGLRSRCVTDVELLALAKTFGVKLDDFCDE